MKSRIVDRGSWIESRSTNHDSRQWYEDDHFDAGGGERRRRGDDRRVGAQAEWLDVPPAEHAELVDLLVGLQVFEDHFALLLRQGHRRPRGLLYLRVGVGDDDDVGPLDFQLLKPRG